jgi:FAD synthase
VKEMQDLLKNFDLEISRKFREKDIVIAWIILFPLKNRYYDAYNIIQAITMSFSLNFRDISKSKFFNKSCISFTIIFAEQWN